jgi:hypothetical protein
LKTIQRDDRFGRWTVVSDQPVQGAGMFDGKWLCRCECGTVKPVRASNMVRGRSQSCGCIARELLMSHGGCRGGDVTRLYDTWVGMRNRCQNPNNPEYHNYGGRGITVCWSWNQSFYFFQRWALTHGYRDDLTIERVGVNWNYTPENCTFIPKNRQAGNKRNTRWVTAWSETKGLADWRDDPRCMVSYSCLRDRLERRWPPEQAIGLPARTLPAPMRKL